jgi:hypothetical protein
LQLSRSWPANYWTAAMRGLAGHSVSL